MLKTFYLTKLSVTMWYTFLGYSMICHYGFFPKGIICQYVIHQKIWRCMMLCHISASILPLWWKIFLAVNIKIGFIFPIGLYPSYKYVTNYSNYTEGLIFRVNFRTFLCVQILVSCVMTKASATILRFPVIFWSSSL